MKYYSILIIIISQLFITVLISLNLSSFAEEYKEWRTGGLSCGKLIRLNDDDIISKEKIKSLALGYISGRNYVQKRSIIADVETFLKLSIGLSQEESLEWVRNMLFEGIFEYCKRNIGMDTHKAISHLYNFSLHCIYSLEHKEYIDKAKFKVICPKGYINTSFLE